MRPECPKAPQGKSLRGLLGEVRALGGTGRRFVLCMKGLEAATGKRLSAIVKEELGEDTPVAVWLGPGHVQEFTAGIPNCMVLDSQDEALQEELITAFYDLSRIEGGQWQLEREPVDLARELADQLAAAYEQLEQAGLQVSVKIADGLPPVWGDRNGVVRVLSNLLTNAYRHGTGTLEARLYREGDHVVSAFSNDAPGMTDEDVERVFERFYTVDRMRTGQNTGLGMAIVKALAERMGGQVSARLEDGRFTAQVSWKAAG